MLLLCLRLEECGEGNARILLLAQYSVDVGQGVQRGEGDVVDEEDREVCR